MSAPKDSIKRALWVQHMSEARLGKTLSDSTKKKMGESKTGVSFTEEHKNNISESCAGRVPWNKGIPHSDAAKAKMRAKKIGIPLKEEHKKKIGISNKGKHDNVVHTPKALEANRIAHLGKKASDETKALMSIAHTGQQAWNKGILTPIETREKMSISMTGIKKSEDFRKNMSGSNNNRWNGGTTPFLKTIRELPEMYEWKSNVMRRDEYKDCFTGIVGNHNLEVHHIIPMSIILLRNNIDTVEEALNCKALWDISNGITMFKKSHLAHHNKYGMSILPKSHYSQKSN